MLSESSGTDLPSERPASVQEASTRDIDEQAALLRGWNQTYDQISAGAFSGSFLEIQLDRVHLFREVTSNALYQTGELGRGTIAVGVPLALAGNATFCGRRCNGLQLHVFSGADSFEFLSPSGLDIAGFVLDEADLCRALTCDELETVLPSLRTPHLRPASGLATGQMRAIFADICEVLVQSPGAAHDKARVASMSRDVIAVLAVALAQDLETPGEGVPPARSASIVRKARALVIEAPEGYTSVEELCAALHVSRRALQYAFQDTLGLKPSTYLRAVRMNGARRAIKHSGSVAEAATLWGFWHFGRFARDYRAMFGELPSETFRRCHGVAGKGEPGG